MKSKFFIAITLMVVLCFFTEWAYAHFLGLIPSDDIIEQGESKNVIIKASFFHPFEWAFMNMEKPETVGVVINREKQNLLDKLKEQTVNNKKTWQIDYTIKSPGNYIFYLEPKPYWEAAEETFIVHYAKVIINAYGLDSDWNKELGLKGEIVPLTRPYGLWSGNVFQGIVKKNGTPLPYTKVEVEFYNEKQSIKAPTGSHVTQEIQSDQNGVFTYAMPLAGWWGFAALFEDDKQLSHNGKEYPVEIGAVLWVKTVNYEIK
ncbi:MAG: DUF4198 domain-containing protein [Candidatus Magnetoovum sp. WYHC-5]|nr:DUF4198 domain-containing protein [Candidatus Magnetoovum sp. WYHC-5]